MNSEPAVDGPLRRLLRVSLLFATFLTYSGLQSPVPGVNEPHYLTKARHYWQPDWCAGDLFLESADAHLFFYQTVGWLAAAFTLEQAAWFGRIGALLLLALGWDQLVSRLVDTRFASVWTAWVFLLLHTIGNFSGEWLVGGVEAKVFSYGFVFWGCGSLLRGQVLSAAAAFGLAVSMHPVVGGWSILSVFVATMITGRNSPRPEFLQSPGRRRILLSMAVLVVLSLPGLVPAVHMLFSSDPELIRRGNFIQFTHRLSHHLDPLAFSWSSYGLYGALIVVWLTIVAARSRKPGEAAWSWRLKWFQWLVAASLILAVAGCLAGLGPRPLPPGDFRLTLMKFYPFRLADILVPLLVSVLVVWLSARSLPERWGNRQRLATLSGTFGIAYAASLLIPGQDQNPSGMDVGRQRQWLEACHWILDETPDDAVIYAVHEEWALRWFCQRPVYVSFKDCPQDASGIVDWHKRRWLLTRWSERTFENGVASTEELRELHETTGISYLVSREFPRLNSLPLYQNGTFYVYSVNQQHSMTDASGE